MTLKIKRKIACILTLLCIGCFTQGQTVPPGPDKPDLPIDGGILIAAFVALCYGAKKLLKNN